MMGGLLGSLGAVSGGLMGGGGIGGILGGIGGMMAGGGLGQGQQDQLRQMQQQAQQMQQQNLMFQQMVNQESQKFTTLSNAQKAMHDAIMAMLNNAK